MTPAENDRLLGWVPTMLPWAGLDARERDFLVSVRARHKRDPAMRLSEKQAAWLGRIVDRFQAEMLRDDVVEEPRP